MEKRRCKQSPTGKSVAIQMLLVLFVVYGIQGYLAELIGVKSSRIACFQVFRTWFSFDQSYQDGRSIELILLKRRLS
jgi:hypothetical protein